MKSAPRHPTVVGGSIATPSDRLWEERVEAHKMEALPRVRAAAEKWLATLALVSGSFGIVTVVQGRENIQALHASSKVWTGAFLLLALLLTLASAFLAAVAAQGVPIRVLLTADILRAWSMGEAEKASRLLKVSRAASLFAALSFAAAMGIAWNGSQVDGPKGMNVEVTTKSEAQVCGVFRGANAGAVEIEAHDSLEKVKLSNLASIAVVARCP